MQVTQCDVGVSLHSSGGSREGFWGAVEPPFSPSVVRTAALANDLLLRDVIVWYLAACCALCFMSVHYNENQTTRQKRSS